MDGVLCNPATCVSVGDVGSCFSYLDPVSCGLVKRLCVELNCKLVISSSWRILHDRFSMQAILNAACPQLGNFMYLDDRWRTGSFNGCSMDDFGRGKEIKAWIDKYPTEFNNFVILDDDSDMEPLMDSFVKTDVYEGFRFVHFMAARSILKKDEND